MGKTDAKAMTPPKETRISDLQLAAFLLAKDYDLLRTGKSSDRVEFIFAGVPEEAIFACYQGNPLVNARKLLAAYRDLKGLLLQQDRRGRR